MNVTGILRIKAVDLTESIFYSNYKPNTPMNRNKNEYKSRKMVLEIE